MWEVKRPSILTSAPSGPFVTTSQTSALEPMVFRLFKRKDKTTQALARTRKDWGGGLGALFQGATLSDDALWEQVEDALISSDVGVDASLGLVNRVRQRVRDEGASDVVELFKEEMAVLLDPVDPAIWDWYDQPYLPVKPFVLMVVGVNGVGKTTSIAKLTRHYQEMGKKVMVAAGDTFRAAAIEQIQVWGERLKIDVIAHQQGSDPGAVAYDAYQAAVAREADVLILDSAGRLHNKAPLIEELRKVRRVFERHEAHAPHQTLLVLDATTGHNGLEQARVFREALGVDGVLLAKLDGTAKGGVIFALAQQLKIPIRYVCVGEKIDDLRPFSAEEFVTALFE